MNGRDTTLFHVYGYRGGRGPLFIVSADDQQKAIDEAIKALLSYDRVEVRDVRESRVVWRQP